MRQANDMRISRCGLAAFAAIALATLAIAAPAESAAGSSMSLRSPFPVFLLDRGRYTAFEAADPSVQLFPTGINDRGQIVGEYLRPGSESGFVRDWRGRITSFDIPGAKGTQAVGINNRGQIVGSYSEDTPIVNNSARSRGFLLHHGKVIRIDVPGSVGTGANGINDRGQVVGGYVDVRGNPHGFLWEKGRFTTLDVPGARGFVLSDINERGQVVGSYLDADGAFHGFLWSKGRFTRITPPVPGIRSPTASTTAARSWAARSPISSPS